MKQTGFRSFLILNQRQMIRKQTALALGWLILPGTKLRNNQGLLEALPIPALISYLPDMRCIRRERGESAEVLSNSFPLSWPCTWPDLFTSWNEDKFPGFLTRFLIAPLSPASRETHDLHTEHRLEEKVSIVKKIITWFLWFWLLRTRNQELIYNKHAVQLTGKISLQKECCSKKAIIH